MRELDVRIKSLEERLAISDAFMMRLVMKQCKIRYRLKKLLDKKTTKTPTTEIPVNG